MEKIKVLNIKTGKTVSLFPHVYEGLKKAGKGKDFDLIKGPQTSPPEASKPKEETSTVEVPTVDTNEDGKRSAAEMIEAIQKAESIEAVNVLIDGESRKTVLKAAAKQKNSLK